MRASAPELLPVFRSQVQGRLLALLYAQPEQERTISELSERLEAHLATVHREIDRLERAGILTSRHVGRTRMVKPNPDSPFSPELSSLALKAFGPQAVLSMLLGAIPEVEAAYIFGSWAERYEGTRGAPPRDVDLIVVGKPDRDRVYAAAAEAERLTGLPVDVTIRSHEAWERGEDHLTQAVRNGSSIAINLGGS